MIDMTIDGLSDDAFRIGDRMLDLRAVGLSLVSLLVCLVTSDLVSVRIFAYRLKSYDNARISAQSC